MPKHEVPYCHGQPMCQTAVNYVSPLSYQYRCHQCQRSEFVQDRPDPPISAEEFLRRRGFVKPDEHLTTDELQKRLDAVTTTRR